MAAEPFEIRGEDDLFRAIQMVEEDEWSDDQTVSFVGWPRYEVTLRGESFDGGMPTRIMPALVALQRSIDRSYARAKYGHERRLSREERRETELIVRVEPGSTTFWADLASALNHAISAAASNMTGPQLVLTILGIAAIASGGYVWKAYINASARRHELDHRVRTSEEDTKRFEIIERLAERQAEVAQHLADTNAAQGEMLKRLQPTDQVVVDGEEIINGELGRRIVRRPREEPVEDRLDGDFTILSVESGSVKDGFRVRVRNTKTSDTLSVSIPAGTLSDEQLEALQSGEWGKRPLRLKINIARIGKRIVRATLISAGLASADEP